MKLMIRIFCLAMLASFFTACGGGGSTSDNNNAQNGGNNNLPYGGAALAKFTRYSYMPIAANATWTYNYGITVKLINVDASGGAFDIVNTSGETGMIGFYADSDARGTFLKQGNSVSSGFLPWYRSFGLSPLIFEDSKIALGFKWEDATTSNGLPVTSRMEITSMDMDVVTPGGQTYPHCIEIQRTTTYSPGETGMRVLSAKYYVLKGVGFVEEIRTWSSDAHTSWSVGNIETIYVTSYNIP